MAGCFISTRATIIDMCMRHILIVKDQTLIHVCRDMCHHSHQECVHSREECLQVLRENACKKGKRQIESTL
jgi:hypothetical protein